MHIYQRTTCGQVALGRGYFFNLPSHKFKSFNCKLGRFFHLGNPTSVNNKKKGPYFIRGCHDMFRMPSGLPWDQAHYPKNEPNTKPLVLRETVIILTWLKKVLSTKKIESLEGKAEKISDIFEISV